MAVASPSKSVCSVLVPQSIVMREDGQAGQRLCSMRHNSGHALLR